MDIKFDKNNNRRCHNVILTEDSREYLIGRIFEKDKKFYIIKDVILDIAGLRSVISYMKRVGVIDVGHGLSFSYNEYWEDYDVSCNYMNIGSVDIEDKIFKNRHGRLTVSELEEIVDFMARQVFDWKRVGF
jgi:hypothetical protein